MIRNTYQLPDTVQSRFSERKYSEQSRFSEHFTADQTFMKQKQ